ncbi:metal-dependent hydrolase [Haladaptatus sp. NG-WS-4]
MYPVGHYGFALLFTAPVVFYLGRRAGLVFTVFVLLTATLPDLDKQVPYVQHHGITHTVSFGIVSGLVVGILMASLVTVYVRREGAPRYSRLTAKNMLIWSTAGVFLGVVSHVVGDILVLLPGTEPVSPFWPVFDRKFSVRAWSIGATARNFALLVSGLGLHTLIYNYQQKTQRSEPERGRHQ